LIFGIVFLVVGAAGFIPGLVTQHDLTPQPLSADHGAGNLFGLFPVNTLHNLVHLLFGVWGVLAFRSAGASLGYARAVAIVYAVLTVMGLVPALSTAFGLVPLYGHDIWLHAALAVIAAYFGWVRHEGPTPVPHRAM
jgi:hypothetical protein